MFKTYLKDFENVRKLVRCFYAACAVCIIAIRKVENTKKMQSQQSTTFSDNNLADSASITSLLYNLADALVYCKLRGLHCYFIQSAIRSASLFSDKQFR